MTRGLTSLTLTDCSKGSELRQASRWGLMPRLRRTATLCWVGLVFCSPTTPSTGTRLTWTLQKLPAPTLNWNCLHGEHRLVVRRQSYQYVQLCSRAFGQITDGLNQLAEALWDDQFCRLLYACMLLHQQCQGQPHCHSLPCMKS